MCNAYYILQLSFGFEYTGLYHFLKTGDLVYPGQNCDVREILRNLIGCLKKWELERLTIITEIKTPDWCIWLTLFRFRLEKTFQNGRVNGLGPMMA